MLGTAGNFTAYLVCNCIGGIGLGNIIAARVRDRKQEGDAARSVQHWTREGECGGSCGLFTWALQAIPAILHGRFLLFARFHFH